VRDAEGIPSDAKAKAYAAIGTAFQLTLARNVLALINESRFSARHPGLTQSVEACHPRVTWGIIPQPGEPHACALSNMAGCTVIRDHIAGLLCPMYPFPFQRAQLRDRSSLGAAGPYRAMR